jgi:hypothetical protein
MPWLARGQTSAASSPNTNPVIMVSPGSLNFGAVAIGSTNDLRVTVQNAGGGTLAGTATVAEPFFIVSGAYSLGANQSQTVVVRYIPKAEGNHSQAVTFTGGGSATLSVQGQAGVVPPAPKDLHMLTPATPTGLHVVPPAPTGLRVVGAG